MLFALAFEDETCQAVTLIECKLADARHAFWDSDACQRVALRECISTKALHALWDCYACQGSAGGERPIPNAHHTSWYCDARQKVAVIECPVANACDCIAKSDINWPSKPLTKVTIIQASVNDVFSTDLTSPVEH